MGRAVVVVVVLLAMVVLFHMLLVHLAQDVSHVLMQNLVVFTSLVTITDRAMVLN